MAGDGVQATDLKRMGQASPKLYVHKDGKTILIPAEKKDEYMAKGYKLSSLRAEDDTSSKGMNKYGLAAVNKDGKFYSYRNGKLTGTFDNMKDLQKHQHDLIKNEDLAQMAHKVEQDHEVQMARSDLYKAAKYSIKLHDRLKNISEEEGLEGWVAAKITKASDYLSSVYHYMDYEMMSEETYLQEGWADDLRKLGARGLDKMKALYDPATAAKVKADDTAGADANTMFKDLTTVHAMNQQDMTKGYDNNTILGYMKKYIEPRNPKAFLDLSKSATPLRKIFPVGQKTTKQTLMTQLQKVAQTMAKVDLPGVRGRPPATQGAESIDYKESMHKRFEKKLAESKKKPVLEDFIGKPISEEEFEKLAEKKDVHRKVIKIQSWLPLTSWCQRPKKARLIGATRVRSNEGKRSSRRNTLLEGLRKEGHETQS